MSKPLDPRGGRPWRRLRAALITAALANPAPCVCWRCEREITRAELPHADLGHLADMAYTEVGTPTRVALEHPLCNRDAGRALGREILAATSKRRRPNNAWISTGLGR